MSPGGARSGEEIQGALRRFVARWADYVGTERSEAQTFLNDLFECYGTNRLDAGARFEDFATSATGAGFMDLHWPQVAIFEMKRPSRSHQLAQAQEQVMSYWRESADEDRDRPAARFVVLCSFQRFEIWEPGRFPRHARISFPLEELPERYESLLFLSAPALTPSFVDHHRALTTEAASKVAQLYQALADRSAAPIDEIQRFTMQCVWTLFAEDLGMIDGHPLQTIVEDLRSGRRRNTAAEIGYLFRVLNQKGSHHRTEHLVGTRYVNGELFARPAEVGFKESELDLLSQAAHYDWRKVNPTIFGSLMEGVLGRDRRWELGAHYTHEVDILKIVEPTIVRPWRERISDCDSPSGARTLLDELCAFRVLDPACGCGNFLYIAYRELRSLEQELKERMTTLAREQGLPLPAKPWPYYPLTNLQGIDIERVAVLIARVTLWMGHRQMIDRFGEAEPVLPLVDLSSIRVDDALRTSWPATDAIVGNPPFLGSQHIRGAFGDDYVAWLTKEFGVGVKDFCTYWFRMAHDHLRPGQRAGLVGTNSVSQNRARSVSLDYIVGSGGTITDAVSSQKWPGEAKVHVSLVNWVKDDPSGPFTLDGVQVEGIDSSLHVNTPGGWTPARLPVNAGRCFQGPIPVGAGFIVTDAEAAALRSRDDADYTEVVRPYLTGEDITEDPGQAPRRWIIDFDRRSLEEARRYPAALDIVRTRVKPERDLNRRTARRQRWWLFGEVAAGMRTATREMTRVVAGCRVGKRLHLAWCDQVTLPSDTTNVFALDDDFSMGVLLARPHGAWAWARASTLKGDLRYTPTSVFLTFPWAGAFASSVQRDRVAAADRRLMRRRSQICLDEQFGLTTLYNQVDEGGYTDLVALHGELDEAVADCYGWSSRVAQDDAQIVRRLGELNRAIAEGGLAYDPFPGPRA